MRIIIIYCCYPHQCRTSAMLGVFMLDSYVGSQLSILFNNNKSKCMCIEPNKVENLGILTVNGNSLQWTDKLKYLGVWLCSEKYFCIVLIEIRRKIFLAVNTILSKWKYTNEIVKLQLLESHCLPILLYATECLYLSTTQMKELNSCSWNCIS